MLSDFIDLAILNNILNSTKLLRGGVWPPYPLHKAYKSCAFAQEEGDTEKCTSYVHPNVV